MPRIKGCRKVAGTPGAWYFKPQGIPMHDLTIIDLALDEFEALRLADHQGLYQADAARAMGVSRQTFGLIIHEAHRKVAQALIAGHGLRINPTTKNLQGECK